MDQLADIPARSIGDAGGAGGILRRQRTYQADQQGGHIGRAATHRRLGDTAAKGVCQHTICVESCTKCEGSRRISPVRNGTPPIALPTAPTRLPTLVNDREPRGIPKEDH